MLKSTARLLGPACAAGDDGEASFQIIRLADGALVILADTCDLYDVYEQCRRVADACLDDDEGVWFTRNQAEIDPAKRTFEVV